VSHPIFVVDAFTDTPFRGNPAGVCPLEVAISATVMQQIAMEVNHAETAFPLKVGEGRYNLRWFTPTQEVPMCGHATLASAHILWSTGKETGKIVFETQSGELTADREHDDIVLDFPSLFAEPAANVKPFEKALGVKPLFVGKQEMFWLVELESEEAVRSFQPDLAAIGSLGSEGVLITAKSDSEADDFVSRLFAPNVGIPEDPVTGSAHCILAPYWAKKLGKEELVGYQASKRGGYVKVEFLGARVLLKGRAVTVIAGSLDRGIAE
jgi:PhzF family phenazine biosynthesis protein